MHFHDTHDAIHNDDSAKKTTLSPTRSFACVLATSHQSDCSCILSGNEAAAELTLAGLIKATLQFSQYATWITFKQPCLILSSHKRHYMLTYEHSSGTPLSFERLDLHQRSDFKTVSCEGNHPRVSSETDGSNVGIYKFPSVVITVELLTRIQCGKYVGRVILIGAAVDFVFGNSSI